MRFLRLNDKHTPVDFSAWLKTGGAVPAYLESFTLEAVGKE